MHQARGRVLTAGTARLSNKLRRCTNRMAKYFMAENARPPPRPPSLLSLVNFDTGKNYQGKPNHARTGTHTPPKTPTNARSAPQNVHTCRHKTSTKQPKTAARQTRKPRTPQRCQGNQKSIQFTRCGVAALRSQHPTNRLRHHANPATSRRSRHATEYAQQHRTHRVTVSARHARRH